MSTMRSRAARLALVCATLACTCALVACDFDVPITAAGTRPVDARLLGDWTSAKDDMAMKVRRLDEATYIVVCDGDLYRVHHSDLANTAFLSVQDIDSDARKYSYLTWALSADGQALTLRVVSTDVIPNTLRDAPAIQQQLRTHLQDKALLGDEIVFRKAKA